MNDGMKVLLKRVKATIERISFGYEDLGFDGVVGKMLFYGGLNVLLDDEDSGDKCQNIINWLIDGEILHGIEDLRAGLEFCIAVMRMMKWGMIDLTLPLELKVKKIYFRSTCFNQVDIYTLSDDKTFTEGLAALALWNKDGSDNDLGWRERLMVLIDEAERIIEEMESVADYGTVADCRRMMADLAMYLCRVDSEGIFPEKTGLLLDKLRTLSIGYESESKLMKTVMDGNVEPGEYSLLDLVELGKLAFVYDDARMASLFGLIVSELKTEDIDKLLADPSLTLKFGLGCIAAAVCEDEDGA